MGTFTSLTEMFTFQGGGQQSDASRSLSNRIGISFRGNRRPKSRFYWKTKRCTIVYARVYTSLKLRVEIYALRVAIFFQGNVRFEKKESMQREKNETGTVARVAAVNARARKSNNFSRNERKVVRNNFVRKVISSSNTENI